MKSNNDSSRPPPPRSGPPLWGFGWKARWLGRPATPPVKIPPANKIHGFWTSRDTDLVKINNVWFRISIFEVATAQRDQKHNSQNLNLFWLQKMTDLTTSPFLVFTPDPTNNEKLPYPPCPPDTGHFQTSRTVPLIS